MIVLLTAGEAPRYYKDVLRVIAQPPGSYLQFRYESALVADALWPCFETRQVDGARCLVAYFDKRTTRTEDNVVPLRFATVVRAWKHGSTAAILLELGGFAETDSLSDLRKELLISDNPSSSVKFVRQMQQPLTTAKESGRPETWENVVTRVAARELFSNEERFFTVHRVLALKGTSQDPEMLAPTMGRYALKPSREYALEVYQFHPDRKNVNYRVLVTSSHGALSVTAGAPIVADSPYDHPSVRMKTGEPDRKQVAQVTIRTESGQRDSDFGFDIPFVVKGRWIRSTGYVVLVGGLLAAPQVASMSQVKLAQLIVVVASSLAAAAVVALGLKKVK